MENYQFGIRAVHQKNIKQAILEAKINNFEFLEIHLSSPQFLPQNFSNTQLREIKNFAEKNKIILQTHSEIGQSLIQVDNIIRLAERKKLERMASFSLKIGARCLTLHPGKAPQYFISPGKAIKNDDVYSKYYCQLFEDSIKHITSIYNKKLLICLENTDNFQKGYQDIISKYLKSKKLFLTWDIMKNYSHGKKEKIKKDQYSFFKKNINYIRNIHISGPSHSGLEGYEHYYVNFLKVLKNKQLPIILEIISLPETLRAKNILDGIKF